MDQKPLENLIQIIRSQSYREGDFTLVSGEKSKFYIDLKATTLHPDGAYWIGEAAIDLIQNRDLKVDAVGGLTLGADPMATAVSLAARARHRKIPAFIVRKEPKSHGTSRFIEGCENLPVAASVIILEDVVTTGGSTLKAIQRVRDAGYQPTAVIAIVDREEGGRESIEKEGIPFFAFTTLREIQKN